MTTFYDSARWGLIPAGSHAAIAYDGRYAVTPAQAHRFAATRWITVLGGADAAAHAGIADFESGDLVFSTTSRLQEWAQARRAMNTRARVYCDLSNLPRAYALVGALPNVVFWLATLDGVQRTAEELVAGGQKYGVTLPPDRVWGQQYAGGMTAAYDTSLLLGAW